MKLNFKDDQNKSEIQREWTFPGFSKWIIEWIKMGSIKGMTDWRGRFQSEWRNKSKSAEILVLWLTKDRWQLALCNFPISTTRFLHKLPNSIFGISGIKINALYLFCYIQIIKCPSLLKFLYLLFILTQLPETLLLVMQERQECELSQKQSSMIPEQL